jgi:hypothetical protein
MSSAAGAIVVLPMNVVRPLPESLEGSAPAAWEALRASLAAHDTPLKTVAFASAQDLWRASAREAVEHSTRASKVAFPDVARVFVEKLSRYSEFTHLVMPSLFVQGARVDGRTANWDGVERPVEIDEGAWSDRLDEDTKFGGAVPAASLHLVVLDAGGRVVHQRQVGIAVLARIRLTGNPGMDAPGFEALPVEDPFADREAMAGEIAEALSPWITPRDPAPIGR